MALPGVTTVLKDRFYILSRTDVPAGPRVCIIGRRTTVDGTNDVSDGSGVSVPSYDPYLASNEQRVLTAFGTGSDLHKGYIEAVAGGATQIYLVAYESSVTDANLVSDTSAGNAFDLAFAAAETIQPDMIVPYGRGGDPADYNDPAATIASPPFGFYADNATGSSSLVIRVSNAVQAISDRSHPCFAVMGVKPLTLTHEAPTATEVATQLALPNLITRDNVLLTNAGGIATGRYVSVLATEMKPLGYDATWGYSNGAALYAGTISQLVSYSATTGKLVFNVTKIRYQPNRTQQQALSDRGVVCSALDFNRRATWVDGITFAPTGSDYGRLSTLRIVFDALQLVRQVAQGFIGEAATLQHRNAFETAITAGLRGMQVTGALLDSKFVVTYVPATFKAIVDLNLVPAFELRNIDVSVSVSLGQ